MDTLIEPDTGLLRSDSLNVSLVSKESLIETQLKKSGLERSTNEKDAVLKNKIS